jgi:hypothetical protein
MERCWKSVVLTGILRPNRDFAAKWEYCQKINNSVIFLSYTDVHKRRSMHKMWSTEIRAEWCYRRNISMLQELFSKILDDICATLSVEYTVKWTPSKSCRKSSSDHLWGEIRMQYSSRSCQWMLNIIDSIRGASSYWPIRMGNFVFSTMASQQGNLSPKVNWTLDLPEAYLVEVKEILGGLNIMLETKLHKSTSYIIFH